MNRIAIGCALSVMLGGAIAGCLGDDAEVGTTTQAVTSDPGPVGLAVEVEDGAGKPLKLRQGQVFYLNQIDMRVSMTTNVDEGVSGLRSAGDFASLHWGGLYLEEQEPVLLANADGTFTRRRFYRGASWMRRPSTYVLEQLDADGNVVGTGVTVRAGIWQRRRDSDDFFARRLRAIQWTNDCPSLTDCTGATSFMEEALVELRYAMHPEQTFALAPETTALRLTWSLRPHHPYTIPVTQVADPTWSYGFHIVVDPMTPPRADGTYAPGTDITFRVTLTDGQGKRLHPEGSLPSYDDVVFGPDPAGIDYYHAFFDPTATWWRRKHRERMLMAEFIGPAQNAQAIRSIADMSKFLAPDDVQVTGTFANDGVYAEFHTFPTAHDLFGGAFDPTHAGWANPVPDTWTHHVPADAPSGTYYLTIKGRRTFMGEDVPQTTTVPIQVGSPTPTSPTLAVGGCRSCHNGQTGFDKILHANTKLGTCAGCHVPLGFELEGPIYVRVHVIHSRSHRFDAPLSNCSLCHKTRQSIQRVSKSACLSCHTSYPKWHVRAFGPVTSIYVGGGRESFQQCTSACHRNHPNSQL